MSFHKYHSALYASQKNPRGRNRPVATSFERRWSSRTVTKKYRLQRKGRRSFDTAVDYRIVDWTATEKTRTLKSAVRATSF